MQKSVPRVELFDAGLLSLFYSELHERKKKKKNIQSETKEMTGNKKKQIK